ncbi:MAG TPA: DUF4142 domain-containing protein [Vicinamibacterales bacterium]|nr:DUF4142 domain-containing protein [Vicinamibacterales bacterium]
MLKSICAGVVTLGLAAAPAFAGQQPAPAEKAKKPAAATTTAGKKADEMFVTKAAKGGMSEVKLGQLVSEKGSSDEVKKFGQRMVTDHGKANDELKSLAQQKNITLPTDLDAKDQALYDRLSKMSGAAFDRVYMREMLTDHRKDVNEFKKESTSGKDPDVKAWAGKTLPTLEEHLKLAEDANKSVVGTSGSKSPAPKGSKGRK